MIRPGEGGVSPGRGKSFARRVATYAAVIPAVLGSLGLIAIWSYGFRDLFTLDAMSIRFASDGWAALMLSCYLPLNLWGPLLLVLTWAYWRRRSGLME